MPKQLKAALSARKVQTLTKPGSYSDGNGLELHIRETGAKTWALRVMVNGKRVMRGLGSYPAVGLADARALAVEHREALLEGRDIRAERQAEKSSRKAEKEAEDAIPTFSALAATVVELRRPTWSSDRHATQWTESLRVHAFPVLGEKWIDSITTADVLKTLLPIWNTKAETATRVRQRMETIFDFAVVQGWRTDNPANGSLTKALPRRPRQKAHHPALPYAEVPGAIAKIRESTADAITRLAFEFLTLTAARAGEVRGAEWSEIDFGAATWTVPAARMKARREHRVPMSSRALAVLLEAHELTGGQGLVFPGKRSANGQLSDMCFTMLLRRCEVEAVPHGFRSSFRDWMAERTSASWAIAESALAHTTSERASLGYHRTDYLAERRPVMQQWADFLDCVE